jgi:hypothetical protein
VKYILTDAQTGEQRDITRFVLPLRQVPQRRYLSGAIESAQAHETWLIDLASYLNIDYEEARAKFEKYAELSRPYAGFSSWQYQHQIDKLKSWSIRILLNRVDFSELLKMGPIE